MDNDVRFVPIREFVDKLIEWVTRTSLRPDVRPLLLAELVFTSFQRIPSSFGSTFCGLGRSMQFRILPNNLSELDPHYVKLPVIDAEGDYTDNSQSTIDGELPDLYPSKFPRKLFGGILVGLGYVLVVGANFAFGWSGWNHWRLRRRLTLGISGWAIAIIIVCHGAGLLLGIN
jgi:hypothetical protein